MEMVNREKNVTILSCGIGAESLPARFADIVKSATTLVGGKRLLELFPDYTGNKIVIDKHIKETIAKLAEKQEPIVILASGDALFHGIAKTVLKIIPREKITIVPNITAAQALCARLAIPWDSASFFSVHGKTTEDINWQNKLDTLPAIFYGDNNCNAANIAEKILRATPKVANYNASIGINLGMSDEQIISGTLQEVTEATCQGLAVLAIFARDVVQRDVVPRDTLINDNPNAQEAQHSSPQTIFGRPDSEFAHHKNMITHSETRAVVLSKLCLKPGIMWDLGAGSGSVGIEVATLQKDIQVYSVEKDKTRVDDIKENIQKFQTDNVNVIHGDSLNQLKHLPDPDTVFIGGGGGDITEILKESFAHLKPGGTIVATAVLLETRTALSNTLNNNCSEVVSISVSRSKKLGEARMMKAENSIEIYVYKKSDA